jgi:hypothetical protein
MAAAVLPTITLILQAVEAAVPGYVALWNAITALRTKNPNMTAAQALALMQTATSAIATLSSDEAAVLDQIPANPAAAPAAKTGA